MKRKLIALAYRAAAWHAQDGQGMAEYALILALVALVVIAALTPLGTAIANEFTAVTSAL